MDQNEGSFDVIILGTGLTESITAAALSKAGFKVAHIDQNPYYGAEEASLSFDELIKWADSSSHSASPKYSSISYSHNTLKQSRQYSVSLSPSIIPSIGPLITSVVSSGVSRYGGFRLLERVGIYDVLSGTVKSVPGSKEDVFKNKSISLLDKRRLMRFLTFAAGDFEGTKEVEGKEIMPFSEFLKSVFSLNDETTQAILYALAYCISSSDATLPSLHSVRRYLRSTGRYGPSAFLVGHYGGAGEIAQGFCRSAAVSGAAYILGRSISSITHSRVQPQPPELSTSDDVHLSPPVNPSLGIGTLPNPASNTPSTYTIHLSDFPYPLTCTLLISSASYIPSELRDQAKSLPPSPLYDRSHQDISVARCIAIFDQPISFTPSLPLRSISTQEPEVLQLVSEPEEHIPSTEENLTAQQEFDTAVLVFPPSSLPNGSDSMAVTALISGEGSMSTPQGKWILYLAMPISSPLVESPESLLRPYLAASLALAVNSRPQPQPLFSMFYIQHPSPAPPSSAASPKTYLISPPTPLLPLPDTLDAAAVHAKTVFWEAISILQPVKHVTASNLQSESMDIPSSVLELDEVKGMWPSLDDDDKDNVDEEEW